MFKKIHLFYCAGLLLSLLCGACFAEGSADQNLNANNRSTKAKISIIIARPTTASKSDLQDFAWFSALSHEYLLFRFGVFNQINVVDPETLSVLMRGYNSYSQAAASEQSYLSVAQKMNANYVLIPEFKIDRDSKTVGYSISLLSVEAKNSTRIEGSSSIDKPGVCLDSCITQVLGTLNIQIEDYESKFLSFPITASGKNEKSAGNAWVSAFGGRDPNHKRIAEDFKKFTTQEPKAFLMYYLGALEYAKAKDFENAAQLLKDLIYNLGPVYPALYAQAARYFRLADKFEDGLQMVKVCEGLNLQSAGIAQEKAMLLEALEENDKAEQAYQEVLSSDPQNYHALLFLMKKYNKENQPEKTLSSANVFCQAYPDDATGILEKGKALFALQRFQEAKPLLSKAVALLPKIAEPQIMLGDLYQHSSDNAQAIQCFTKALELSPENPTLYIKIAQSHLLMKDPRAALAVLKKVEKKFYDNMQVQKEIGMAEYQLGDIEAAKRDLNRCATSGEPDLAVFLTLGELYATSTDYAKALEMYEKALKIDPDNSSAEKNIRTIKSKMRGKNDEGMPSLGKSVQSSGKTEGGISAITIIQVATGVLCVGGLVGGFLMNKKVSDLKTEYDNSHTTETVNSLHTSLENDQLYRNILYGVGAVSGIGFVVTFAIPSHSK